MEKGLVQVYSIYIYIKGMMPGKIYILKKCVCLRLVCAPNKKKEKSFLFKIYICVMYNGSQGKHNFTC